MIRSQNLEAQVLVLSQRAPKRLPNEPINFVGWQAVPRRLNGDIGPAQDLPGWQIMRRHELLAHFLQWRPFAGQRALDAITHGHLGPLQITYQAPQARM